MFVFIFNTPAHHMFSFFLSYFPLFISIANHPCTMYAVRCTICGVHTINNYKNKTKTYSYNKREEAQEAISALNNVIPEGGSQPLSVRLAEEHGKAKAAHFMSQMGVVAPNAPPPPPPPPPHMAAGFNNMVHRGRSIKSQQRFQKTHPYMDAKKII